MITRKKLLYTLLLFHFTVVDANRNDNANSDTFDSAWMGQGGSVPGSQAEWSLGDSSWSDGSLNSYSLSDEWTYSWDKWGQNDWSEWLDPITEDVTSTSDDDFDFWDDWDWDSEASDDAEVVEEDTSFDHWSNLIDYEYGADENLVDQDQWSNYDWTNWGDWGSWDWTAWNDHGDWGNYGFDDYFWGDDVDFPSPGDSGYSESDMFGFEEMALIDVEQYWTDDPKLNWCMNEWYPERVEDPWWVDLISEFMQSGNITNWCVFPGQVMVISDLSNVNLNDPDALPRIFKEIQGHCTEGVCKRQLENRKILDTSKLVDRVWRLMDIYKQMGCPECFCDSQEKKDLEVVMAITKDHLKNNEFLSYNTTSETPGDVAFYFSELKGSLGLDNVTLPTEKRYTTLLSMDQATKGPGKDALKINKYAELAQGLYNFCGI